MFYEARDIQFNAYQEARRFFIRNPRILIYVEKYVTELVNEIISENYDEIERDYNAASYLHPFWAEYPPEDRGRSPVGDQVPWIEVGEHAVGHKINRLIAAQYEIAEVGLPSGADNRFVLFSDTISAITDGFTDRVFLFLDIKSVGPRDNYDHAVLSPYQVSGDGIWTAPEENMVNSQMTAYGRSAQHSFFPAMAPIYAFPDGSIAPSIHLFVKPVYEMVGSRDGRCEGQPLESIKNICVPNGLLLCVNPNYMHHYPGLFYPGKDDKSKDIKKLRARVSFEILKELDAWRVRVFTPPVI